MVLLYSSHRSALLCSAARCSLAAAAVGPVATAPPVHRCCIT
jgi:hypothetical protein